MSAGKFPLEPLCAVRGIRLRLLETELRRCREHYDQVEQQRLDAAESLAGARQLRRDFADSSWLDLFGHGNPTGSAMDRHEWHLLLLDQGIEEQQAALLACEQASVEALDLLDQALATWRKARNKLDAIGEMKQEWQRDARVHQERHEEQNLEELMLHQASTS